MKRHLLLGVTAAALAASAFAVPANAMHTTPGPVGEPAPEWSGHYSTPDIGHKGEARPWEAGPAWDRETP